MTDTRQPPEQQPSAGPAHAPNYADSGYEAPAGMPSAAYYPGSGGATSAYGQWVPQQQGQWTARQGPWVPPQQGPWAPQQSGQWNVPQGPWGQQPAPQPQSKNALAMPALILGIITLALSPIPFLNQAGILVGFVGAGLGIAALIIGVRRRIRVVMSAVAVALSVLGLILAFVFTQSFVNSLNNIGSTTSAGSATPAQSVGGSESSDAPAAPPTYTLSITGSAKKTSVNWNVDGSSGSADQSTKVPWTRTMTPGSNQTYHYASVSANTYPGTPGDLICTITDQTGKVLDTKSAASQGGEFGSAQVMCSASAS